ncbi:MAG: nitroreductase family protein [Gammaproteobacteria bacterium]|nr:nitroreductase family protein [Gammaproteobacteria bacterium]
MSNSIDFNFERYDEATMIANATRYAERMVKRRTVRDFSDQPIPEDVIRQAILAAGSAPSGANQQPWHFVVVQDQKIKTQIREAAEAEEREFYAHRASEQWLDALKPLGTDAEKPFLSRAPVLIAVFSQKYSLDAKGDKQKHYYPTESVGIATGMMISALHLAGVATLTHTPSPMKFLNTILKRPDSERPFVLLVCGYPEVGATVPDIAKKSLDQISSFF